MKQTCREAILDAFDRLESQHGKKAFNVSEIVKEVFTETNDFAESTIRTHVTSRMCMQAPQNHWPKYTDLDRIAPGEYRRRHG